MSEQKVEVKVTGVHTYKQKGAYLNYFVLFQAPGQRYFSIWVGYGEACAIDYAMTPEPSERPLTHDAMALLVAAAGGEIDEVWINDLRDETFYSVLRLHVQGEEKSLDLRPSDAVALALRVKCPIYVSEAVLEVAEEKYLFLLQDLEIKRGLEIIPPLTSSELIHPPSPGAVQHQETMKRYRVALNQYMVLTALEKSLKEGLRPRDWDASLVDQVTELRDGSRNDAIGVSYGYLWAMDKGNGETAGEFLERALSIEPQDKGMMAEKAFWLASHRQDTTEARRWLALAEEESASLPAFRRAQAAILRAEGNDEGAAAAIQKAREELTSDDVAELSMLDTMTIKEQQTH